MLPGLVAGKRLQHQFACYVISLRGHVTAEDTEKKRLSLSQGEACIMIDYLEVFDFSRTKKV
jgi:hypothetical protein